MPKVGYLFFDNDFFACELSGIGVLKPSLLQSMILC